MRSQSQSLLIKARARCTSWKFISESSAIWQKDGRTSWKLWWDHLWRWCFTNPWFTTNTHHEYPYKVKFLGAVWTIALTLTAASQRWGIFWNADLMGVGSANVEPLMQPLNAPKVLLTVPTRRTQPVMVQLWRKHWWKLTNSWVLWLKEWTDRRIELCRLSRKWMTVSRALQHQAGPGKRKSPWKWG